MDGTTYHRMGTIIEENIQPILKVMDKGIQVVFVTGRPIFASHNQLIQHGFTKNHSIIVGYNGGLMYDLKSETEILKQSIDTATVNRIFIETAKPENSQCSIWAYSENLNEVYTLRFGEKTRIKAEATFFEGKIIYWENLTRGINSECLKLLVFNPTNSILELMNSLKLEVHSGTFSENYEVNAEGVNKGMAVQWLSQHFNINLKDIMAMGDGGNDYPMMKIVGLPVAMKNSSDAIKQISKKYIDLNAEDGAVKAAIQQFILEEEI